MGLSYNGVDLSHTFTESIEHGPGKDPSGTDQLYTVMRFRVRAVLAPGTFPSILGEDPAATATRIRHLLTAPRRPLSYTAPGGTVMVNIADGRDDANGPWPDEAGFRIQMVTQGSFVVTFAVTCRVTDCQDGSGVKYFLSLRWTESTSYDRNMACTKRRSGFIIISARSQNSPDGLRGLVTPDIPPGFRREQREYTITEDGLQAKFLFVDKQLVTGRVPPAPATKITGKQYEQVVKGAIRKGMIQLRVTGDPATDPNDLLNCAIRIGMARVFASDPAAADGKFMVSGGIGESLDDEDNTVELNLEWMSKPAKARDKGGFAELSSVGAGVIGSALGAARQGPPPVPFVPNPDGRNKAALGGYAPWLGKPLAGSDPLAKVGDGTRGVGTAAALGLIAAALNDPCGSAIASLTTDPFDVRTLTTDGLTVSVVPNGTQPPDDYSALYTDPATDSPGTYDHYKVSARYQRDGGTKVMPATGTGPNGDVAKAVKFGGGLMTCSLAFSATRAGGPPELPTTEPTDPNVIFDKGVIEVDGLDLAADGVTEIYTVAGVYNYSFLDPKKVVVGAPIPPWLDFTLVRDDAGNAATLTSDGIGFPGSGTGGPNTLIGQGTTRTNALVGGGVPGQPPMST